MPAWEITTLEYDVPVERLLNRRLGEDGEGFSLDVLPDGARVQLRGGKAAERLAEAVTKILLRDLQYFVLARMTDSMPLSLGEKRTLIADSCAFNFISFLTIMLTIISSREKIRCPAI